MNDAEHSATTAPAMTFAQAIQTCLDQYFVTAGRAGRAEYWWFQLFCGLATLPFMVLSQLLPGPLFSSLALLAGAAFIAPQLAVGVRRLHDHDRSGWWLLLALSVIGLLPLLYWLLMPGQAGANRHGERQGAATPGRPEPGILIAAGLYALMTLLVIAMSWLRPADTPAPGEAADAALPAASADPAAGAGGVDAQQGVVGEAVSQALAEPEGGDPLAAELARAADEPVPDLLPPPTAPVQVQVTAPDESRALAAEEARACLASALADYRVRMGGRQVPDQIRQDFAAGCGLQP